jgi:hypothetical protein
MLFYHLCVTTVVADSLDTPDTTVIARHVATRKHPSLAAVRHAKVVVLIAAFFEYRTIAGRSSSTHHRVAGFVSVRCW